MPLYMDRHELEGAVSAAEVAGAHEKDLAVQDKYGAKYLNYCCDMKRGCIFCLVEAPSKEAALGVHREAHGMVPHDIIEVDPITVGAIFGDIHDVPAPLTITSLDGRPPEIDSGFRIIVFTDLEGSTALTSELGDAAAMEFLRTHNAIVREKVKAHSGREIKHTGDGFMVSFNAASPAVECAIAILRAFRFHNEGGAEPALRVRIGLSAGEPVAKGQDLFGAAVQLAARLCAYAEPEQIVVAGVVAELCLGKTFASRAMARAR
jgi:hypothetical protein